MALSDGRTLPILSQDSGPTYITKAFISCWRISLALSPTNQAYAICMCMVRSSNRQTEVLFYAQHKIGHRGKALPANFLASTEKSKKHSFMLAFHAGFSCRLFNAITQNHIVHKILYGVMNRLAPTNFSLTGILMVQPPSKCFWIQSGDSDRFVAILATSGDLWVRLPPCGFLLVFYSNHSSKIHILSQDRQTDGSEHCLMDPYCRMGH